MMALKKILADILNDLEKLSVSLAVLEKTAQKKPGIDLKTIRELIANDLQKHFPDLGKAIASLPDGTV
jgi:hypothetical protein